jgi:putative transposase
VALIRAILATSPFHSEGHRKVRVRLRQRGVHVGKARVLRLMRPRPFGADPARAHPRDPAHAGRITTDRPDELWGTDATCFWTEADGWCWFFGAIDHATDELVGWKATKRGDRWAALEPLYQGVRHAFGGSARTWRAG